MSEGGAEADAAAVGTFHVGVEQAQIGHEMLLVISR
jgi:hypothetical protein